jgi:hypothetical protein
MWWVNTILTNFEVCLPITFITTSILTNFEVCLPITFITTLILTNFEVCLPITFITTSVLKPILLHKGGIMDIVIRKLSEKNRTLMIYMFNTAYWNHHPISFSEEHHWKISGGLALCYQFSCYYRFSNI